LGLAEFGIDLQRTENLYGDERLSLNDCNLNDCNDALLRNQKRWMELVSKREFCGQWISGLWPRSGALITWPPPPERFYRGAGKELWSATVRRLQMMVQQGHEFPPQKWAAGNQSGQARILPVTTQFRVLQGLDKAE